MFPTQGLLWSDEGELEVLGECWNNIQPHLWASRKASPGECCLRQDRKHHFSLPKEHQIEGRGQAAFQAEGTVCAVKEWKEHGNYWSFQGFKGEECLRMRLDECVSMSRVRKNLSFYVSVFGPTLRAVRIHTMSILRSDWIEGGFPSP